MATLKNSLRDIEELLLLRNDLAAYFKQAWQVIESGTTLSWNWHLDALCEHLQAVNDSKIHRLLIAMPPRHGKCVKIGSMILLANGYYKPIEDIQVGDIVLSSDGVHITKDKVVWKVASGRKRLLKITLNDGRSITTTPEHRLYGWDEWIEAGKLQVGDPLCVVEKTPNHDYKVVYGRYKYSNQQVVSSEDAFLLAVWLAEGTKGPVDGFQFTSASQRIRANAREIAKRRGWSYTPSGRGETRKSDRYLMRITNKHKLIDNAPVQFLKDHGIRYCTTKTVHVPESIFRSSNEIVARFLGTYIACDGHISQEARSIGITTVSERMARDLQLLFARFAIRATIHPYEAKFDGKVFPTWRILVSGSENFRKFLQHIRIPDKQDKVQMLVESVPEKTAVRDIPPQWRHNLKYSPGWFRFYGGGLRIDKPGWTDRRKVLQAAATEDNVALTEKVTSGLGWRKIVTIEDAGEDETFDIETEKYHAFFAEGVLSHNSSLVSVIYPSWVWINTPGEKFLTASYSLALALRDTQRCRELIDSQWYQSRFGDSFQWTSDQNVKSYYSNSRKGQRIATSVEGSNTGQGADQLIVDDSHNVQEIESDLVRRQVLSWWDTVMVSRLNDQTTGKMVIVGQRVHEEDLIGHLLETGDWEYLCLPAEYEPNKTYHTSLGYEDPRTKEGEPLWKDKFPKTVLSYLKKTLGIHYYAQYQQTPIRDTGNIFKSQYFFMYTEFDTYYVLHTPDGNDKTVPKSACRTVISTDLAMSEKAEADYTVFLIWAVTPNMEFILREIIHDKMETPDAENLLWQKAISARRLWAVIVEDVGFSKATIQRLRRGTPVQPGKLRKGIPIIAFKPKGDKTSRAQTIVVWFAAGNFYFNPNVQNYTDYKKELLGFPRAAHDDMVDATSACDALFEWGEPQMTDFDEVLHMSLEEEALQELGKENLELALWLGEEDGVAFVPWWSQYDD